MKAISLLRHSIYQSFLLLVSFPFLWGIFIPQIQAQVPDSGNVFLVKKNVELGVNVTSVLFSALGNSNNSLDPGRFPWTVKAMLSPSSAIRFGVGINLKQENQTNPGRLSSFNNFLSFRMGHEWRIPIERRWMAYWGIDGIIDYRNEQVVNRAGNDFVVLKLESWGIGGGPVMGLQFAVADRIILGSEASFYGVYQRSRRKEEFRRFPEENLEILSNGIEASLNVPRWLYVSVRL